jgi:phosphohistidine phosphatase
MKLLVIRHGRAGTAAAFAASGHNNDDLRPLTVDGRKRMRQAAKGLQSVCPKLDVLGTSPLVRAIETAQLVARAYGKDLSPTEVPALAPGSSRDELLAWLRAQDRAGGGDRTIGIVGHEPDLGLLVGWLLCGDDAVSIDLKKGAACLLDVPDDLAPGAANLTWLLPSRLLRRLAR